MRKISVYVITTAAILGMAASIPVAAYAGTSRCGGGMIVIGGSGNCPGSNFWTGGGNNSTCGILPGGACNTSPCPNTGSLQPNTVSIRPNTGIRPNTTMIHPNTGSMRPETVPIQPDITQTQPDEPIDWPEVETTQDSYVQRVVDLVNKERVKAGLSPLSVDSRAANAAQTRAKELERSFSHTRPDGSNFHTALSQAGVNTSASGENIAYGQKTPESVMESWMNSSGHKANILGAGYTSIGVGHYQNASGTDYWVQLFLK